MPEVNQWDVPTLSVTPFDTDTAVSLLVLDPAGVSRPWPTPITADAGATWTGAEIVYDMPGIWRQCWTVTGTGAGSVVKRVSVGPDPARPPGSAARVFATTGQLADYLGEAVDEGAERALRDASREIARLTHGAVYPTDPLTLTPTDPVIATALREATCELVRWWAETGDASGAGALLTSASIGGVSLGWTGANAANRVGPMVYTILAAADLLNGPPMTYG
jgi:hypothetical protein